MAKVTTVIIVLGIVAVLFVVIFGIDWKPTTSLNVYSGRLKLNLVMVKTIDGSPYQFASSQLRMIHGTMDYADQVASFSGLSITGDMKPTDNGKWYLIIDYGTNTTCWLDRDITDADTYITRVFGADGDRDGFDEEYVEITMSGLGDLKAGESYKEREINLAACPARVSGVTFTSLTNATAISTTAYSYKTATGYTAGFTEGDLARIAKVQITFNASASALYADNQSLMLTHLKLGSYTFTNTQFGTFDLANCRWQLELGDQINSQQGKPLYYEKNGGDLWASFELKFYAKYGNAGYAVYPTISIYFYSPDGTTTTAFSRSTAFTS